MTTGDLHRQPPGALSLIIHQCRYELLSFRRDRQAGLTTVVMPLILLVAFVSLAGQHSTVVQDGRTISVAQFYVPGLIAFAVVASSFASLLVDLVTLRQAGILKRRRATPVPAWALIGGRTLSCAAVVLGTSAVLLFIGRNNYNVHFASAALPAIALTIVLGTAAFCCFAYAIAPFIRNVGATQPIIQLVLLPLYIISGVLLPDSKNPEILRQIARVFPLEHIANGLHRAFSLTSPGIGMTAIDLAILAAWIAVGLAVAIQRFQWVPR
ncbi:MAG: ABC transporter permease [Solirubrobacteraceae bacterium]